MKLVRAVLDAVNAACRMQFLLTVHDTSGALNTARGVFAVSVIDHVE
jgi:hypothetical protein